MIPHDFKQLDKPVTHKAIDDVNRQAEEIAKYVGRWILLLFIIGVWGWAAYQWFI